MAKTSFELALEKYVKLETEAVRQYLERYVEPLKILADPEKLMGKPFEQWTSQDHQMLGQIYGSGENPYTDLLIDKEIEEVNRLKSGVEG